MATLESIQGSSLVPDLTGGLNVLLKTFGTGRERTERAEARGLIDTLGEAGVSSGQEQKTLLRLSQLLTPQQLNGVRSILASGDAEQLATFQKESDDAFKFAVSLEGLPHQQQLSLINIEISRLQALPDGGSNNRIASLIALGNKAKGDLDVALSRQKILSTDTKSAANFAKARRERQSLARQERTDQVARDSFEVSQLPVEQQAPFLVQKIFEGEQRGENVDHLRQLQGLNPRDRAVQAQSNVNQARRLEDIIRPVGLQKPLSLKGKERADLRAGFITQEDFDTLVSVKSGGSVKLGGDVITKIDDKFFFAQQTTNPDGTSSTVLSEIPGNPVNPKTGLSLAEEQAEKAIGAGAKTRAERLSLIETQPGLTGATKSTEKDFVNMDAAIDAAKNVPALNQTLALLQKIETGGIDAVVLATARALGVESGDQAELTFNLRKNVLKQLKPTFGAAFTEREGKLLAEIEASESKSTNGNIRLIKRALRIHNDLIRVGISGAKRQKQDSVIEDIEFLSRPLETLGDQVPSKTPSDKETSPPADEKSAVDTGRTTPQGFKIFERINGSTFAVKP